jgi:hypothetical protein
MCTSLTVATWRGFAYVARHESSDEGPFAVDSCCCRRQDAAEHEAGDAALGGRWAQRLTASSSRPVSDERRLGATVRSMLSKRSRGSSASATTLLTGRTFVVGAVLSLLTLVAVSEPALAQTRTPNPAFCNRVKSHKIVVSQAAQSYCFGSQPSTGNTAPSASSAISVATPANVAASNLAEDVSPNGTRGYGQSETSVAANGPYVVEAWNDATAFFSPCGSPQYKEEGTGFAFSANGGATFTDLGGLPNNHCGLYRYGGDPSVETVTIGGTHYFYISSLFNSVDGSGLSKVAMSVCTATGTGAGANLACSQPIVIARSSECTVMFGQQFCSFLDKQFLTVDPVHQRLYASFTEFGFFTQPDSIELAACDISNPAVPRCRNGAGAGTGTPYLIVQPSPANGCENEGAYPGVDSRTGDVYVAFEHNIETNLFGGPACQSDPVRQIVKRIPFSHLTFPRGSGGPSNSAAINVVSMDSASIAGYNRFPANDFPRIAVSRPSGTVSIVWNDSRYHPLGDILMQSYSLGALHPASGLVRLNQHTGGLHFLPALRNADSSGHLNVSWYERANASTTRTNVYEAPGISPRTLSTPPNVLITNVASDWNTVTSDITPNFGDYTDNYAFGTRVAISWADGRNGTPQAFFARR